MSVDFHQELGREDGHDVVGLCAPLHAAAFRVGQHLVPEAGLVQPEEIHSVALKVSARSENHLLT